MTSKNEDVEILKSEYQQLSTRITRLGLITLGLLLIVTFTVTNAVENADFSLLKEDLEKVEEGLEPYPFFFENPIYNNETEKEQVQQNFKKALNAVKESREKYNKYLEETLTTSLSLFGAVIKIKLLAWIFILPFILILSQVYLSILHKKQKLLLVMAKYSLEIEGGKKSDELLFSRNFTRETAYLKYPNQFEKILYFITIISLLSYLIIRASPLWRAWSYEDTLQYFIMILTTTFYLLSYYYHICFNLDSQCSELTRQPSPSYPLICLWQKIKTKIKTNRLILWLKSKPSILPGSLLIILSLFLSTSASCNGVTLYPKPGYELFYWNEITNWISVIIILPFGGSFYWVNAIDNIGRYAYILSVILAFISLVLLVISFTKFNLFECRKIRTCLFFLSTLCALIIVTDFAFNTFWFKDEFFLLSILCWLIPIILLGKFLIAPEIMSLKCEKILPIFNVFIFPLIITASIYVVYAALKGIIGLPFYFVGIILLSLGYMKIWKKGYMKIRENHLHKV